MRPSPPVAMTTVAGAGNRSTLGVEADAVVLAPDRPAIRGVKGLASVQGDERAASILQGLASWAMLQSPGHTSRHLRWCSSLAQHLAARAATSNLRRHSRSASDGSFAGVSGCRATFSGCRPVDRRLARQCAGLSCLFLVPRPWRAAPCRCAIAASRPRLKTESMAGGHHRRASPVAGRSRRVFAPSRLLRDARQVTIDSIATSGSRQTLGNNPGEQPWGRHRAAGDQCRRIGVAHHGWTAPDLSLSFESHAWGPTPGVPQPEPQARRLDADA